LLGCEWVALQADSEAFLCCCDLAQGDLVAVGSSRGRVHRVCSQGEHTQPRLAPITAGDGPVLALVCISEDSPLLLASVAGRITLIDHVVGCRLRSVDALPSLLNGVMAEALCQPPARRAGGSGVLELGGSATCTAAVCIAGGDEQTGGGVLIALQLDEDSFMLDAEHGAALAHAAKLDWRVTHDAPVYAVTAAGSSSLLVAATGHTCMLHRREDGTVLRRLAAGSGVLYALALSPNGDCLLAAGSEEVVHAFHFPSGTRRAKLPLPRGPARECSCNFGDDQRARLCRRPHVPLGRLRRGDNAVAALAAAPAPRAPADCESMCEKCDHVVGSTSTAGTCELRDSDSYGGLL